MAKRKDNSVTTRYFAVQAFVLLSLKSLHQTAKWLGGHFLQISTNCVLVFSGKFAKLSYGFL